MTMEETVYFTELYDSYHGLLTDRQDSMLALYYEEDYSLAEIAEHYDISRQAVRDNIRRGQKAMEDYESRLHINAKRKKRRNLLLDLLNETNQETIEALLEIDGDVL